MKLNEFYKITNEFAPKTLSDEYCKTFNCYDNSGILVDTGEDVNAVLFTLDLSMQAIEKAIAYKVKLIVTHHPVIYGGIQNVCVDAFQPLGEKLVRCIQNGISVISMHLNLDCAEGGIDASLKEGIEKCAGGGNSETLSIMHPLSQGGYGRAYTVGETTLGALAQEMEKEFSTSRILAYGKKEKTISRIASFCGSGFDEESVRFAVEHDVDVIVSSDPKHHVLTLANEKNISVIVLTHYASEYYGFKKYYEKIRQHVGVPCLLHTDEELL